MDITLYLYLAILALAFWCFIKELRSKREKESLAYLLCMVGLVFLVLLLDGLGITLTITWKG